MCSSPPVGSLRAAFSTANATADDVEIVIPVNVGRITLNSGELAYNGGTGGGHALTLQGSGNTIDQTTASARVINDTVGTLLTINGLTITGGSAPAGQAGGGVRTQGAATVTNSTITDNFAPDSAGGLRVSNGNLILTNSTISDNNVSGNDAGVFVNGAATVTNSTINGNRADSGGQGGGLEATGAIVITNSTISDNTAAGGGGGIRAPNAGLTLVYSTVAANSSNSLRGANIDGSGSIPLTSFGSVVALAAGGGTNCHNLSGTTSHGFNLEDDGGASCGFSIGTGDLAPGSAPNLGSLANNGGSTQTRLPQAGSPLVDAIPVGSCQASIAADVTTDQIGTTRPQGPACDVGAVEVPTELSVGSGSGQVTVIGGAFGSPLVINVQYSNGMEVAGDSVACTAPSTGPSLTFLARGPTRRPMSPTKMGSRPRRSRSRTVCPAPTASRARAVVPRRSR